ncbi:hypothetical protein RJ640_030025 [Escallonia rubra]|uniref:MLO-like protein n=1 Tax=Escallonia rubra TaxID=112253 RepID=A0AA88RY47_9ASTE|nr:hypothetical protein RJ640_030025 [Escallonia rubra]
MAEEGEVTTLETTPSWAVATVCFVLISVSILIEHGLHLLAKYFNRRRRKSLNHALSKIKSELMLLGFISLLLNVCEKPIANICIPKSTAVDFLPCKSMTKGSEEEPKCEEQGKISLISRAGVQQLQLLIFALAISHVFSCFLTFSLGMAKMRKWELWETETRTLDYQFSHDPRRFQLIHQTSFGKRHLKFWSEHRFLRLPACFLRQFFHSVSKVDYFILRHGFIMAHFAEGSTFDFQKYLRRALEKDLNAVVRGSVPKPLLATLYPHSGMEINFELMLSFARMLLVVGTKLQGIITKMCLDTSDKSHVIRGTLLVRPSDHFFWFGKPKLLLHLMHFILVQVVLMCFLKVGLRRPSMAAKKLLSVGVLYMDLGKTSFQDFTDLLFHFQQELGISIISSLLTFALSEQYKFGLRSCFHRETHNIVIRIVSGLLVQILCGYVTLPLYALVTQMGTSMKKSVFPEEVALGLRRWRIKARKKIARSRRNAYSARPSLDASLTSFESSASLSTLDASFSVELDHPPMDDGSVEVKAVDEDEEAARNILEKHKKLVSFEGFDSSERRDDLHI